VVCERCAAHPGHRCLNRSLRRRRYRSEFGIEFTTLDVELTTTRPLNGDTGVLSRTSAVELCPEILGPCTPHRWRVHRTGCAALTTALPGHRRHCLDTDPPAEPGEACARLRRRSTSSRHCLWASGEAASPGGLRSNSLTATSGPFGAGTDWAAEPHAPPPWTQDGVRREASRTPLPYPTGGRDDHFPVPSWS
jgi:hypothetical protein